MRLHGGEIAAANAEPGLIVSLRLPLAAAGIGAGSSLRAEAVSPSIFAERS